MPAWKHGSMEARYMRDARVRSKRQGHSRPLIAIGCCILTLIWGSPYLSNVKVKSVFHIIGQLYHPCVTSPIFTELSYYNCPNWQRREEGFPRYWGNRLKGKKSVKHLIFFCLVERPSILGRQEHKNMGQEKNVVIQADVKLTRISDLP